MLLNLLLGGFYKFALLDFGIIFEVTSQGEEGA